jgi:hypothetical protein
MIVSDEIQQLKEELAVAEDNYCHAFARGDWDNVTIYSRSVSKIRFKISKILKKELSK